MKRTGTLMMTRLMACALALGVALPALAQQANSADKHEHDHDVKKPTEGVAVLLPTKGNDVRGVILLRQEGDTVHLRGKVWNLSPGKHGFHIHQFGDLRAADGKSAGGHFSPNDHPHGGPDDAKHHAGDFGNITANEEGVAMVEKQSKDLKLHFAIGRAIVVHEKADDLKSQPSGDAGARIAIGVIGFANIEDHDSARAPSDTSVR
ncbi:MAG: superoxide dismutase family protein [Planctomycetales bacterium]|nr:superoxide dismutase family protein [Planctomycetales bacterium]